MGLPEEDELVCPFCSVRRTRRASARAGARAHAYVRSMSFADVVGVRRTGAGPARRCAHAHQGPDSLLTRASTVQVARAEAAESAADMLASGSAKQCPRCSIVVEKVRGA